MGHGPSSVTHVPEVQAFVLQRLCTGCLYEQCAAEWSSTAPQAACNSIVLAEQSCMTDLHERVVTITIQAGAVLECRCHRRQSTTALGNTGAQQAAAVLSCRLLHRQVAEAEMKLET